MKDNLIITSKLLGDFNSFLEKRSIAFLTRMDGTLDNIFQWHFELWKKDFEYLAKDDKLEEWSIYSELSRTMDSIFKQIETRALNERASFPFFKRLLGHAEKYKMESVSSHSYAQSLLDTFYQVYFQQIHGSPEKHSIWDHYFPKEWKVTKTNLENSENIIADISLDNFINWAVGRISEASDEMDLSLDEVSRNLFPEVDPVLWARILIFIYSPYDEDQLRSVIERPWNFGFMGRVKIYHGSQDGESKRMYKDEEKNTFDLTCYLFEDQFSEINLERYIKALEQLSYPKESVEERKRLGLNNLFNRLLTFVNSSKLSSR